ncbi:MAG: AI-2E family transporter [Oscillatoriales cyanobacterium RM1_1_9]|nr:AI-2E family transporter [Oscillatoriales cyanobacterium SM2_3_0]NJO45409.1 AI-2E family transporter [Oscillatoriales cyanobacterium RM2_1_1]NJO72013.1 AI-2E family transporter [Oscillatoriales cyanobacterium RM1_1_9]
MAQNSVTRLLITIAGLVVIIAGIRSASGLLGPILLALFIVLFCNPIVLWLQRKGLPGWAANIIVILGVILAGLTLILFLGVSINRLSVALPRYQSLITEQQDAIVAEMDRFGIEVSDILELEIFQPGRIIQLLLGFLKGLLNTLSSIGLTLFIFVYMLAGSPSFSQKLQRGLIRHQGMLARLNSFGRSISVYLFIKGCLGLFTAIGQVLLLWAVGVDFALLWGVLSFLLNFIPNIGYIISLIPPVLLALLEFGLVKAVLVLVGYTLINNFFDMVIAPRYLGQGLDLSSLVTFLAVIIWSWILGPVGAFLALPLTVMIKKLVLESFEDTRLLAVLAGTETPLNPNHNGPQSPLI